MDLQNSQSWKNFGINIKSSPGTMLLTAAIFIGLAFMLYWLRSCGSMVSNVGLLIYALLGSALYIALVYSLFTPGVWWYKLIVAFFLVLLIVFDWQATKNCNLIKDTAARFGLGW